MLVIIYIKEYCEVHSLDHLFIDLVIPASYTSKHETFNLSWFYNSLQRWPNNKPTIIYYDQRLFQIIQPLYYTYLFNGTF